MEDNADCGRFITIEAAVVGTAGRFASRLCSALSEKGLDIVSVPRFSAGLAGSALEKGYARDPFLRVSPVTEVLLMSADAAFLTERSIAPAVRSGRCAVKPGYMDTITATLIPRLREDDIEEDAYRRLKTWLKSAVVPFAVTPDLTIILEEDVAGALDRASLERGWRVRESDVGLAEEIQKRLVGLPEEGRKVIELGRDAERALQAALAAVLALKGPGAAAAHLARGMRTLDEFGNE